MAQSVEPLWQFLLFGGELGGGPRQESRIQNWFRSLNKKDLICLAQRQKQNVLIFSNMDLCWKTILIQLPRSIDPFIIYTISRWGPPKIGILKQHQYKEMNTPAW